MGRKKIDLTGQRFGKLVAVSESTEMDKNKNIMWYCLCDCGNSVRSGKVIVKEWWKGDELE